MSSPESARKRRQSLAQAQGRTLREYKPTGLVVDDKAAWKREYKRLQRREAGAQLRTDIAAKAQARREAVAIGRHIRESKALLHDAHVKSQRKHAERAIKRSTYDKKEELLSAEQLRKLLSYNPLTGNFHWLITDCNSIAGNVAGNATSTGYWVIGVCGEKFRAHRLAWLYVNGCWPTGTIDHRDTDRTNNRIANLRDVSQTVNMQNMRNPTKANTSGCLGVYWSGRRNGFMASVSTGHGKQKRRGPYKTAERAYVAYIELKRTHHEGCTL